MASGGPPAKDLVFYKKVINKSRTHLIEDLDPAPLLDVFLEEEYLTATQERDIRELASTSDKNREILSKVSTKGVKGYKDFKKCLIKSHQEHLVQYLDTTEVKLEETLVDQGTSPSVSNSKGYKCSVCDLSYDTVQLLAQHTLTPEHISMVEAQQQFAKLNLSVTEEEETGEITSISKSMPEQSVIDYSDQVSHCYLCNINFTSPVHANSHLTGKPHKRKKALFDLRHQQPASAPIKCDGFQQSERNDDQSDSQIFPTLDSLESSNTTEEPSKKGLTCEICNVPFSSEDNAQQHYDSEKHKKKELLLKKQKLGESLPLSCDICSSNFSGPESAEAHFNSEKHKKKEQLLKKQKLGESLPLSCDICSSNFSGPESAEAHFNSEKHKKKAYKVTLEDTTESYELSCEICDCPFTSEENAKQHYEGKKHRKNLALHASGDVNTQDASLRLHDGQNVSCIGNDVHSPVQNRKAAMDHVESDDVDIDFENLLLSDI